jgi:allantoin racemase
MTARRKIAIINPNSTVYMTEDMAGFARQALGESWDVLAMTNTAGPASIQSAEDGDIALPGLVETFHQAIAQGAEAAIIGCFDDTGLEQLRNLNLVPVVGLGQASCLFASVHAARFSIVTTTQGSVPVIEQNVSALGLSGRCVSVQAANVPVLHLSAGDEARRSVVQAVERTAKADQVGTLVLGCAGMAGMASGVAAETGFRIVNPVTSAAALAAAIVAA